MQFADIDAARYVLGPPCDLVRPRVQFPDQQDLDFPARDVVDTQVDRAVLFQRKRYRGDRIERVRAVLCEGKCGRWSVRRGERVYRKSIGERQHVMAGDLEDERIGARGDMPREVYHRGAGQVSGSRRVEDAVPRYGGDAARRTPRGRGARKCVPPEAVAVAPPQAVLRLPPATVRADLGPGRRAPGRTRASQRRLSGGGGDTPRAARGERPQRMGGHLPGAAVVAKPRGAPRRLGRRPGHSDAAPGRGDRVGARAGLP